MKELRKVLTMLLCVVLILASGVSTFSDDNESWSAGSESSGIDLSFSGIVSSGTITFDQARSMDPSIDKLPDGYIHEGDGSLVKVGGNVTVIQGKTPFIITIGVDGLSAIDYGWDNTVKKESIQANISRGADDVVRGTLTFTMPGTYLIGVACFGINDVFYVVIGESGTTDLFPIIADLKNGTDGHIGVLDPVTGKYVIDGLYEDVKDQYFHVDAPFSLFEAFYIDGIQQTRDIDYRTEEGSTRVTVLAQTIQNLDNGEHTATATFKKADGSSGVDSVSQKFTVNLTKNIIVTLNGVVIAFDQPPIIENGRTLVPLRAIFEAMGADVDWNQSTQTVTAVRGEVTVSLTIGSNVLIKNGTNITLDVPAKIVNGRTLVPVRAIAESFGASVNWNANTRTVIITD